MTRKEITARYPFTRDWPLDEARQYVRDLERMAAASDGQIIAWAHMPIGELGSMPAFDLLQEMKRRGLPIEPAP